uniref:hypothetical protein n=1 Tax=Chishuiella sp. TaxID=1969467 RepID=UPI0028AD4C06
SRIKIDYLLAPTFSIDTTKKPAIVGQGEKKKEKTSKCPNCNKDITLDEIKAICVNREGKTLIEDDTIIINALPILNKYRKIVAINTCVTKAHFLSQISQESKFFILQEKFKYTNPERMRKLFYSYFKEFGNLEKQKAEAKRLSDLSLDSKNWKTVANAIYGKTHPNGKNNTDNDDGWRY